MFETTETNSPKNVKDSPFKVKQSVPNEETVK